MAKVLNEERFNPSRLPGLSLWLDAQATTTISSSTATGVTSWSDRSGMGNTFKTTTTTGGGGASGPGTAVFTERTGGLLPPYVAWVSVASSSNGTKLAAAAEDGLIYTSSDSGLTWIETSAPTNSWTSIASSSDGIKLVAVARPGPYNGGIFTSIDSGLNWNQTYFGDEYWLSVASNSDGTKLVATAAYTSYISIPGIFTSIDSGINWVSRYERTDIGSATSSSDGMKLVATSTGPTIFISSDGGVNWNQIIGYDVTFISVASSSDGMKLAAVVPGGGGIYTSSNAGQTWIQTPAVGNNWMSIASSSDGARLVAVSNGGGIYISSNGGLTWTLTSGPSYGWKSVASSSDGTKLVIVDNQFGGYLYTGLVTFPSSGLPPPIISNTAIISQPSVFFPPGAQMVSTLNSGLGAPTISGCVLWLDAADTATYVGPTSSLTGWKDKSGSGYVATPLDGAITTATLNGTPVLEFSNNRMIIPNFTWNMSFTSIMVWKPTSGNQMIGLCASTATNATWYDYISTGNWALAYLNSATTSTDTNYIQGPTDRFPGSPAPVVPVKDQWFIFSIGYTAGTTTITNYALNGTARTSSAVFPQTGTNTGVYFINGLANYAYGNSQIAEIMHFNRSLGSDERQTIEGYLATKWGLRANLPPAHPYSSVPYTAPFALNPSTPVSKSIFIAYQTPSLTSTMRFATGNDVSGGAFGFSQTQYYVSAPYQYDYGNTRWTTNTVLYTLPTVLSGIYDATAGIIRGDRNFNADSDVRESAMINIISNTPYSLGRSPISTSIVTSASFHLCEIIAYNRALATTDRQMIEGYMAWKWGITNQLPIGHPYKEFPPSGEQVIIPSTPANVMQGLISWLDMADTSSYTLSGTTLKTIRDKATTTGTFTISGKPNNFSFSRIGSLPALVFPGNNTSTVSDNTFLFRSVPVPSVGSACMVLIPKSQFTASKLGILGWGSPGNSLGNPGLGYNAPTTTIQTLQAYNTITNTFFGPSLNLAANTPTILFWAWYGGNMVYFSCNGTTLLSSTQGTTTYYNPASTDTQFYIGNDGGFGAQFTLGELVMYNQYGETPFRNLIEGHLAWKWGLQTNLPAYHPYYYSAPGLQSLTEVNALSQPSDILNLTMWLDAADTATLTLTPTTFTWTDKSAVANHVVSTTPGNTPTLSTFGTARRPSVYFGPGKTAKSTYNSGASAGQFSAFIVASVPTLSYLLISTGQYTNATTPVANQTFGFYASNGSTYGVCSPFVGGGGTKVGNYSTVCGATVEMFASVSGLTTLGNLNFGSTVSGTRATTADTQWVFGDCSGDPSPKSFHVHEFITYSRQLATNERWVIEGYLYWKWMNLI